ALKQVTVFEPAKRLQAVSELRIMRKHRCPWLVALYNAFYEEARARVYAAMELMDAGSLAELVEQHREAGGLRDEAELRRMLRGLAYLHEQRQVHRDLKPANVLLNSQGAVKISDFGISSQLEATGEGICSTSLCSTFVGTTCYMSPERLRAEAYSYSSDIWSFGLILLELASGAYPFAEIRRYQRLAHPPPPYSTSGGAFYQLLGQIADEPAPTLPAGHFSASLRDLLRRCLDKDPTRRPTAQELLSDAWLASGSHSHA
ncbi:hypothetical protein EMIHUDRAFT_75779, partial [Emiliania huxleyi CCMP1516]|uniref:mitogen-activated protein kinase kinase n=2 Tax=Emiliania huxleyi TaxID=2903 RepID=A0A0D3J1D1_EMIH1